MSQINVLAIDGGGLRGIIPAILIEDLERRLGGLPIHRAFHLIAGTSTGGLIAMGLGCPVREGLPMTAAQMRAVYQRDGARIFPPRWYRGLWSWLLPKYSPAGLQSVLDSLFGDVMFSSALTPLMICSYDLGRQVPFMFKSARSVADPAWDWKLSQVGRATSAAPTFLPAYTLRNATAGPYTLVDGGVYVNNPVMAAYAEAVALYPHAKTIHVVSVGTGNTWTDISTAGYLGGLLPWASRIPDVMMDGVSEAGDYETRQLCSRAGDRFWRLQPELGMGDNAMDDASPAALRGWVSKAETYARDQASTIAEIAATVSAAAAVTERHP